ncbi:MULTISPECIES: OmpW/AlkL family protein [Microbulbifer]|uniref:OmpW family protein n=1 Tax=Microbulbifer celer TaxID=435905 RepID=A0ABW3UAB3_9GAMM|nr:MULTISPECIES: OmpW family outer membrane protein [Microbulbifer]UFN58491.1 outer membrane beta-barrel protein [Microbulbifer celer]
MNLKRLYLPLCMVGFAGLAAQPAYSQSAYDGSVLIRVGASYVEPDKHVYSEHLPFYADDPLTGTTDVPIDEMVPADVFVDVDLDDDTTWYISAAWMAADHWGVELYHSHSADLSASLYSDAYAEGMVMNEFTAGIGDFETNTTSLLANWYPLDASCLIQPYVGVGVSYVDIDQDFVRPVFDDQYGREGYLNFGSEFGWTAQIGVDFNFGRDSAWQVNASAMYVSANPEFEMGYNTPVSVPSFTNPVTDPAIYPVRIKDDLDMDPWIFNLGVGYKFSF